VELGHQDIEQYHILTRLNQHGEGVSAAFDFRYRVTLPLQLAGEQFAAGFVVIDDEDAARVCRGALNSSTMAMRWQGRSGHSVAALGKSQKLRRGSPDSDNIAERQPRMFFAGDGSDGLQDRMHRSGNLVPELGDNLVGPFAGPRL